MTTKYIVIDHGYYPGMCRVIGNSVFNDEKDADRFADGHRDAMQLNDRTRVEVCPITVAYIHPLREGEPAAPKEDEKPEEEEPSNTRSIRVRRKTK